MKKYIKKTRKKRFVPTLRRFKDGYVEHEQLMNYLSFMAKETNSSSSKKRKIKKPVKFQKLSERKRKIAFKRILKNVSKDLSQKGQLYFTHHMQNNRIGSGWNDIFFLSEKHRDKYWFYNTEVLTTPFFDVNFSQEQDVVEKWYKYNINNLFEIEEAENLVNDVCFIQQNKKVLFEKDKDYAFGIGLHIKTSEYFNKEILNEYIVKFIKAGEPDTFEIILENKPYTVLPQFLINTYQYYYSMNYRMIIDQIEEEFKSIGLDSYLGRVRAESLFHDCLLKSDKELYVKKSVEEIAKKLNIDIYSITEEISKENLLRMFNEFILHSNNFLTEIKNEFFDIEKFISQKEEINSLIRIIMISQFYHSYGLYKFLNEDLTEEQENLMYIVSEMLVPSYIENYQNLNDFSIKSLYSDATEFFEENKDNADLNKIKENALKILTISQKKQMEKLKNKL